LGNQKSLGVHCILELHGCPAELLDDLVFIQRAIEQGSQAAHSSLLHIASHKFSPQGVTAVGLLAESHLSIHTWPERGYAAVDIFTCGGHTQPERACDVLVQLFQPRSYNLMVLSRGWAGEPPRLERTKADSVEEPLLCQAHA